jgi:(1->4)-alpha-D-glucan 1-alpha-D-glucosylmutase
MLYQTLIGAWPGAPDKSFIERMQAYALKAVREAKQETSWTNPNEAYEAGLQDFIGKLLDPNTSSIFLTSFAEFAVRTMLLGALNSLSQLVLKLTLPGVPDFYQGTEFWDLSLVDPDNRRPVDFAMRRRELERTSRDWTALVAQWQTGRIKLVLMCNLMLLRRRFPDVFQRGSYEALAVSGPHAGNVVAFARSWKRQRLVIAVGRQFAALTDGGRRWPAGWDGSLDLPGPFEHLIGAQCGRRTADLHLSGLFRDMPVTVLRQA